MWEEALKNEDQTSLNQSTPKTLSIKQIKIIGIKRRSRQSVNTMGDAHAPLSQADKKIRSTEKI